MKFSIKDFFSKCDQIRSFLRIWSHLLNKSLTENFIICAVTSAIKTKNIGQTCSKTVAIKRCCENMQQNYWRTPTTKCDSAWVFFCKFYPYFQNTFSQEHLWGAASVSRCFSTTLFCLNVPLSNWIPLNILLSFINTFSTSHLFGQTIVFKNIWLGNTYYNFCYSVIMLNIRSCGFDRPQYRIAWYMVEYANQI